MVGFREAASRLIGGRKPLEAINAPFYKRESDIGKTRVDAFRKNEQRVEHPQNMDDYDDWCNDGEVNTAINVLTDIIAPSFYTEMEEGVAENHKHKKTIDEYCENINADEKAHQIIQTSLQKGFSPVERLEDYDLKLLAPETFFMYKDDKGNLLKYTQERIRGDVITSWETKEEIASIIMFIHRETTSWPYGKALAEPIGGLVEDRAKMNKDMAKAVHRWGYPIPVISTSRDSTSLKTAIADRDSDEAIIMGNVLKDEFNLDTLTIDPQARFIPYIELMYYQIGEALHAPLLLQMKNATEASANVMMDSVDRLVGGIQRYHKRRWERFLFEPQVGNPVPRLIWGQPKTGLEDITLEGVAAVLPYLARNQREDLLKQFGLELPDAEKDPLEPDLASMQQQPFKKPMQAPTEAYIAKIADMATSLEIIETNYREKTIPLTKAMRMGGRVIEVHLKRTYGSNVKAFESARELEFKKWVKRLTGMKGPPKYEVTLRDS